MDKYTEFLNNRSQLNSSDGFKPLFMPEKAKDFQIAMIEYSCLKGRAALFEDCGLGKTLQQLAWAQNAVENTNKNVLILTPLAVSSQTVREGEKFGIECKVSRDGKINGKITIANYEKLHLFDPNDFIAAVCDESSIIKNYDGVYRKEITEFLRKLPYRLLCTATAAPNDYTELGTSSEALGHLGHIDMLTRFFKNENNTIDTNGHFRGSGQKTKGGAQLHTWEGRHWRFKGHSERAFWQFVCSWSRAMRRPSDMGFSDKGYILPPLIENEHLIECDTPAEGFLFPLQAIGLKEQRDERRRTIKERCEKIAELTNHKKPALVWCHLNEEGKLLKKLIPDSVEVSGNDSTDQKEEKLLSFVNGDSRVLITKARVAGFGMNFQHCSHVTFFPSHSYEQYYQGVRRCYRFGNKNKVTVDIVTTAGERGVAQNLRQKAISADRMFSSLVKEMQNELHINRTTNFSLKEILPQW